MDIDQWWPKLRPSTRKWLMANNGEAVPPEVLDEITEAGVSLSPDEWWVGESDPDGFYFSDRAIDWIEAKANDED